MKYRTIDPFYRNIILKNDTWEYKILRDHPEVGPYIEEIQKLTHDPYYILKDLTEVEPGKRMIHPTREEYFDLCQSKTSNDIILLRAVVDHATDPSEVITVFKSKKLGGLTTEGGIVYVRKS